MISYTLKMSFVTDTTKVQYSFLFCITTEQHCSSHAPFKEDRKNVNIDDLAKKDNVFKSFLHLFDF